MENRRYRVVRLATTEYVDFDIGVPQGSGLSPLLFTLLTSEISHLLKCDHVEFADNITLHYTHWDHQTIVDMLNSDLRTIESWSAKWRLSFGHKSSYFVFHRPGTRNINIDSLGGLHFFGRPLKRDLHSVYLLGVHLDAGLSFRENTIQLLNACRRRRNILHGLVGSKQRCTAEALLVAHNGFIRSKMEVACAVYVAISTNDQAALERFQSSCLRLILYARDNTPAVILDNEFSTSSLSYRRDDIVLCTCKKILAFSQSHPLRVSLDRWWT